MHPDFERANSWSGEVIGAAIEVHRIKGPGLLESIYEKCLMRELELREIPSVSQTDVPIEYKGAVFSETLQLDVLVDNCLLIELKAVERLLPIHKAQLLSYMKLLNAPLGLLINFNETTLTKGLSRMVLPSADSPDS